MTIDWENRTETCDFWIGVFPDEIAFIDYVGEDPDYYQRVDEDENAVLSRFIADQGQQWYDHDMIEMGFDGKAETVGQLVDGYSYAEQYADQLTKLAAETGIPNVNAFLFIRAGEIENPKSMKTSSFDFRYVGQITYKI